MNFIERFFSFTFQIPAFDLFLNCVDIWNDFLDRILAVSSCRASATKAVILQSYSAPILALFDHLLMRIQMQFNGNQLEDLSDIASGNDGLSEREDYFQRCIGVMIKAGEILPKQVLEKFVARYSELHGVFARIQSLLQTGKVAYERCVRTLGYYRLPTNPRSEVGMKWTITSIATGC